MSTAIRNDTVRKKRSVVIRTPDHHLRIFVSSTLTELAAERVATHKAITKLHFAPVMFESGARPHPAQDLYQAYLSQSHIFIGIYWQSYGWTGPGMQVSGLEDEYNRSDSMPRLIYIKDPSPDRDPALSRLLDRIKGENASSYKHFTAPEELRELVENDLILLLTEYFETARAEEQPLADLMPTTLTNVPIPRNQLVGREMILDTVCRLLVRNDVALVTLTGPAGTGKSRLGIQVALELRDKFKDGVFMVALEAIHDPGLVIPTITKTLNIAEIAGGLSLNELLKGQLCNKHMLLLLDNFEQILQAGPQVADLLEACPKVKILVTSRAPLHLRAEKEFLIPPLVAPPIKGTREILSLTQYSAVRLFIQRCQAVKADFQVTNENAPAIAEICHRLDGLPLAIELAAARIKLLPPQLLLARLDNRFDVLRGGTKDLPERQRTMYGAIDWSYSLLNENERRLFQRLSVFCGGFTIEAATEVCVADDHNQSNLLDELEMLVDSSLIRSPEEAPGELRMKMLESIREFAFEHLMQSNDAEVVHNRYNQYYLTLAEQAEIELHQSSQHAWNKRIDGELDNLRAVMAHTIEIGNCEIALRIATALWRYWWTHGYWSEGLQWLQTSLNASRHLPIELKANALNQIGWLTRYTGDFPNAITVLQEAVTLWQQTSDQSGLSMTLSNLGASLLNQGDNARATALLEEALALSQQQGDKLAMYVSLEILGNVASRQGEIHKAIDLYSEALALAESEGDEDHIAKILNALGDEYVMAGDYDRGEECFSRAAVICKKLGNRIVSAYLSGNRAIIALKKGNYSDATDLLTQAISVIQELGDKDEAILCLEPFAYIAIEKNELERALRLFAASESLGKEMGMSRPKQMQEDFDTDVAILTNQLNPATFNRVWSEGSRMTLDMAIAYAIGRGD